MHSAQKIIPGEIKKSVAEHIQRHPGMRTGVDEGADLAFPLNHHYRILLIAILDDDVFGVGRGEVLGPAQHPASKLVWIRKHEAKLGQRQNVAAGAHGHGFEQIRFVIGLIGNPHPRRRNIREV